jgi:hypothetical protein
VNIEISAMDECCKLFVVSRAGSEVARGVWCPQSKLAVMDGEVIGICLTEDELRSSLRQEPRQVWVAGN